METATPPPVSPEAAATAQAKTNAAVRLVLMAGKFIKVSIYTILIVALSALVLVMGGWMYGSWDTREQMVGVFAKDVPIRVAFEHGSVEEYGFFRNYFWRTDKSKVFNLQAVVSTDNGGTTTLKDTSITATSSNGKTARLKPGSINEWQLIPASVAASVDTTPPPPTKQVAGNRPQ